MRGTIVVVLAMFLSSSLSQAVFASVKSKWRALPPESYKCPKIEFRSDDQGCCPVSC